MKLHQTILAEMPYEIEGEMERAPFKNSFISDNSLERLYTPLGTVQVRNEDVSLYLIKGKTSVLGSIRATKDGEPSNRLVFSLMFKEKHTLIRVPIHIDEAKILQVDKVSTDPDYEGQGIASYAYSTLAERGHIVLSDVTQFQDGKQLWKRMATKAHLRKYKIFILDDLFGVRKENGKPVEYDGSNIDDAKIWSKGEDYSKYHVLLMMTT
jgi:hypothetical protein